MEPVPQPQPAYVPPQPAAQPMPQPYVPPAQPAAPAPEQYGGGGFLGKFDWVEIGILAAGLFAMFHIIDYYRKKAKAEQANQATITEVAGQVEKLQMNFDGLVRRLQRRR